MDLNHYDPNKTWHPQTVRLTLMQWEYKKEIEVIIGGNCLGSHIFDSAIMQALKQLDTREVPNYDTGGREDMTFVLLEDKDGNTLLCEDDEFRHEDWLMDMVVGIEIIAQADEAEE